MSAEPSSSLREGGEQPGPRLARGRALPSEDLAGLRQAFAEEVAERLPRLQAVRPHSPPAVLAGALHDAHTLGSSAVVLGEPEASRVARELEASLLAGDATDVPRQVARLTDLLAGWSR